MALSIQNNFVPLHRKQKQNDYELRNEEVIGRKPCK